MTEVEQIIGILERYTKGQTFRRKVVAYYRKILVGIMHELGYLYADIQRETQLSKASVVLDLKYIERNATAKESVKAVLLEVRRNANHKDRSAETGSTGPGFDSGSGISGEVPSDNHRSIGSPEHLQERE